MKNKNFRLAILLLLFLAAAAVFALLSDSSANTNGYGQTADGFTIIINEICSKNETIIADNEGKYRDYIELYNPGEAVSLAGCTLTDGRGTSAPFGNILLGAGEYRVFFLSNETTGFALGSSGGDCIQLLDPSGNIIVQANTAACLEDQVMLYDNGAYQLSYEASPGFPNTSGGITAFREGQTAQNPSLVISEILIDNTASMADENGFFSDVIELHNISDSPVYLGSYFLSDSLDQRFQFRLPDISLPADAYLVIFCDGLNYLGENGEIHANFGLSHGETLVLTDSSGAFVSAAAESAGKDISLALTQTDGFMPSMVSLGYANSDAGAALFQQSRIDFESPLVISEVLLSSSEVPYNGTFLDVVEIQNRSNETIRTSGWYLSDGSDPYTFPLPEQSLAPGECMVIECSTQTTGFSLSTGESVLLIGPAHLYAPVVVCTASNPGMSISLQESSLDHTYSFSDITLGYKNVPGNHERYRQDQMPDGIVISELMSANNSYLKGAYSTTSDWVELYNNSNTSIHLADYCLTDDADNPGKYRLPDITLAAGEYCVIFLNDDSRNLLSGYPVLPFSLSSQGDQLYLSKENSIVDYVLIPSLVGDISYGRAYGCASFSLLSSVSPGRGNGSAVEMSSAPTIETPQGTYDDVDWVEVVLSGPGNIYYTTDCTEPTAADTLYTGPIRLTSTTVLRVICQEQGKLPSEPVDLTYLINEYNALPAVSVVTEPDNLWSSQSGIYVNGPGIGSEPPYYGANFWMNWEKESSLSLFETDGSGFSVNCGIKIFGAFTRVLPKKSLACMFRDRYGDAELSYPLFGDNSLDTYESIILRTSGQDAFLGRMRDVVLTSLMGEATDVPVQQYKPVVVYLNGQYWGLHYIREKLNENYVAGHYNVPADTVTIVEYAGWTNAEYRELVDYVLEHDMSVQEYYDYVCSQIDVDNYIDFYIAQMWVANTDNGNVKFFRIGDGKWTWFFFDTDLSLKETDHNSVYWNLTTDGLDRSDYIGRTFAAKMLSNDAFREKFLTRLAWQMNNIWTEENVINRINEIEAMILPVMERECERWECSYYDWQANLKEMRYFAQNRNRYMLTYIQNFFVLSDEEMRSYGFDV